MRAAATLRPPALICALTCALALGAVACAAGTASGAGVPPPTRTVAPARAAPTVPSAPAPGISEATVAPGSSAAGPSAPSAPAANGEAPVPVALSGLPPSGHRLSAERVLEIADTLPKLRSVRAKSPGSYGNTYLKGPDHWQVSYFTANGRREIGQVIIDDATGRVLEQWTGFQVAWSMARGYPGAFGRHADALYVWLPLCILFLLPFLDIRRPLSMLHLDLLVLLSFSVSLAFFNHADIYASVPLTYPPLLYLLGRMLWIAAPGSRAAPARRPRPFRLLVPTPWLALGVVFLLAFRIGLNVTDSNVIDVGYAGVIGAQRIVDGRALYGGYPSDNEHGDTYGPFNYEAYVPFEQVFGFSGTWDDLPAAHAAAIVFDLLAAALLFLLGRRVRGPDLGTALAYAWVAYPFTLFTLDSNSNDTLVAVLVLGALLAASSAPARGALAALASLTKFAPLALAPLLATHALNERAGAGAQVPGGPPGAPAVPGVRARYGRPARRLAAFVIAFVIVTLIAAVPALRHDSLDTIYERTIGYQTDRGSPFSVWGLYGGLGGLETAVQIAAAVLAVGLALLRRRPGMAPLAAACAAVTIAVQLGLEHWFYLYIAWFFPLVMLALLARRGEPWPTPFEPSSAPARSTLPAAARSIGSAPPSATGPPQRSQSGSASASAMTRWPARA